MRIVNVRDFEGLYVVTDEGRIYSTRTGNEIKPTPDKRGYLKINLHKDGKVTTKQVHCIVYYSFTQNVGLNRNDELVIDHIDGNRLNNALANLRKITTRQNTARAKTNKYGRGVHFFEALRKFGATIQFGKTRYHLGVFDTADEAAQAYKDALATYKTTGKLPDKRDRTQKRCGLCKQMLPVEAFYYVKGHGRTYYCKECSRRYEREKRVKNKNMNIK